MTKGAFDRFALNCYDFCKQARDSGISSIDGFNKWLEAQHSEFAKHHKYIDVNHNEKVTVVCNKIFFLMLRGIVKDRVEFEKTLGGLAYE